MDVLKEMPRRDPINGTFELTGRCNLKCNMCLVRVNQQRMDELNLKERTADEWIHMAEQAKNAGTVGLLLTGGEIMLRPDFCQIYEAIAKMGFILTIYTNATMVTEKIMETLRKFPPHKIGVTIYGASNETYKRMCGCADGFDRFVDGVHKLSTLPSLLDIRSTIVNENFKDLQAMRDFTLQKFGPNKVLHISRTVIDKIRDGVTCPKESRLTPEQNVELIYEDIIKLYRQIQNGEIPPIGDDKEKLHMHHNKSLEAGSYLFKNCTAGITQYMINWSGRMYACELLDQGYTEPFCTGFEDAWNHLPDQYPVSKEIEECKSCRFAALCETCPAVRLSETGDWFGLPEYACKEAKSVYQILSDLNVI